MRTGSRCNSRLLLKHVASTGVHSLRRHGRLAQNSYRPSPSQASMAGCSVAPGTIDRPSPTQSRSATSPKAMAWVMRPRAHGCIPSRRPGSAINPTTSASVALTGTIANERVGTRNAPFQRIDGPSCARNKGKVRCVTAKRDPGEKRDAFAARAPPCPNPASVRARRQWQGGEEAKVGSCRAFHAGRMDAVADRRVAVASLRRDE